MGDTGTEMRALVTGGGGFLGKAIVKQLLDRGYAVRSLARGDYPELRELGAETHRGDIADADVVLAAVEGCDLVFHVAAKAGVWGPHQEYYDANVTGTLNVLEACRVHAVGRLVYTSTPSVVYGDEPIQGADESIPYPDEYLTAYPETKAQAERAVLQANTQDLLTVALRPHLIWGPGDNHLIPRIIARARAGKLKKIGDGSALVDSVYIDDAARAHVLAAEALSATGAPAGKAYFITQGEPWPVGDLIDGILKAHGLPPCSSKVHPKVAYAAGWLLEKAYTAIDKRDEPMMTRFVAKQLSTAHYFDISAAKRDFGYEPQLTIAQGLELLAKG